MSASSAEGAAADDEGAAHDKAAARARAESAVIAARASYGRLLAWLARQWRDIAAAEDALADAFTAALERWPADGVPDAPEGWLLAAARRRLVDGARRRRRAEDPAFRAVIEADPLVETSFAVPDERLRLLFVCAHPAIDPSIRAALMLQTVLGLDAARIGSAFLVSPDAMAKRLVRAKAKIKAAGIRFELPEPEELKPRVDAVLEAVYGAWVVAASGTAGAADESPSGLDVEALHLAELVATALPDDAEALGLFALLLACAARAPARLDPSGAFVPLDRQDPGRWDRSAIAHAGVLLERAAALNDRGPFQLEAAIQLAHCHRIHGGPTPWPDIVRLYDALLAIAPTIGARLGHAIAVAEATGDPARALALVDAIAPDAALAAHQPWWATRAHLLAAAGRHAAAAEAFNRASALAADPAMRAWLAARASASASVAPGAASRPAGAGGARKSP